MVPVLLPSARDWTCWRPCQVPAGSVLRDGAWFPEARTRPSVRTQARPAQSQRCQTQEGGETAGAGLPLQVGFEVGPVLAMRETGGLRAQVRRGDGHAVLAGHDAMQEQPWGRGECNAVPVQNMAVCMRARVCVCVCVHFDRRCCMLFGLFLQSRGCMCSVR